MKKFLKVVIAIMAVFMLAGCATNQNESTNNSTPVESVNEVSEQKNNESQNTEATVTEEEQIDNGEEQASIDEEVQEEGYEIITSESEITVEEGAEVSFDITFTNPDESSIREYITCEDQDDIISVQYSPIEDNKITVTVDGLKSGDTEIVISDYNYPEMKAIVKVNVTEKN